MSTQTLIKDAVTALHNRLSELTPSATPEQLAYLGKSIQNIGGQGTILDIVALTDDKLQELIDAATTHLANMTDAETNALGALDTAKTDTLDEFNTTKINALSDMVTAKDSHISEMDTAKTGHVTDINTEGTTQVAAVTAAGSAFADVNDVPGGSTIMTEVNAVQANLDAINDLPNGTTITENLGIENGNLRLNANTYPMLFGVLSRYGDHSYGINHFTSELGQWHNGGGNTMLSLLTGVHSYVDGYVGFYKPPGLQFLQGSNGNFIYKRQTSRYAVSGNIYNYPYALLGTLFIKNTTGSDITRTFSFGGSSYWGSGYEGASLQLAEPDETDDNRSSISALNWSVLYSYSSNSSNFSQSVNVTIPAGKTVALLMYTSDKYITNSGGYQFFMSMYVKNFRSAFMTAGLEIDMERTLKAWQRGNGLTDTFQIWH